MNEVVLEHAVDWGQSVSVHSTVAICCEEIGGIIEETITSKVHFLRMNNSKTAGEDLRVSMMISRKEMTEFYFCDISYDISQ